MQLVRTRTNAFSNRGDQNANLRDRGLVFKRRESVYRAGRSPDWIKVKKLKSPANNLDRSAKNPRGTDRNEESAGVSLRHNQPYLAILTGSVR